MKDATGRKQELIERVAQRHVQRINDLGPQTINRPLNEIVVPEQDQMNDWTTNRHDPAWWQGRLEETVKRGLSPIKGLLELGQWDQQMQKKVK